MSIIVATALGPHDHDARELAGMLAKRLGETIILAHVSERHGPPPQVIREMLERATHEIARFGASAEYVLLSGDPGTALTDYARRAQPSFVIIGGAQPNAPRGRGKRRKARHLIDTLAVPVLCVPHAASLLQALLVGERFRVLVSGARDAKTQAAMLAQAHALRRLLTCDVSVLCSSREVGPSTQASRAARDRRYDLVILDAAALEAETDWPFHDTAKPMLFVASAAQPEAAVVATRSSSGKSASRPRRSQPLRGAP